MTTYNPGRLGHKLSPEQHRTKRVDVRFSAAEYAHLVQLAKAQQLQLATYLRFAALAQNLPPIVPEINAKAWTDIGKVFGMFTECIKLIKNGAIIKGGEFIPDLLAIKEDLKQLRKDLCGE